MGRVAFFLSQMGIVELIVAADGWALESYQWNSRWIPLSFLSLSNVVNTNRHVYMNTASFHQPITTELTVLCHALFIDIFATTGQNKLLQNFHLWLVHFFSWKRGKMHGMIIQISWSECFRIPSRWAFLCLMHYERSALRWPWNISLGITRCSMCTWLLWEPLILWALC